MMCMTSKRPRRVRGLVCMLLLIGLVLCSVGCEGRDSQIPASAEEVLRAMLEACASQSWPDGTVRTRRADPASPDYLPDALVSALFGEASRGWFVTDGESDAPMVDDAAMFLSSAIHPAEVAVFRCTDAGGAVSGTASAAKQCRARLEALRAAWAGSADAGERFGDYAVWLERAVVAVEGQYVMLVVADDPDAMVNAARGVIRGGF